MCNETDDCDAEKDQDSHGKGDDDVAGNGEGIRDHAQHVAEQDEHKRSEDERKIAHAVRADIIAHHTGHELISHFRGRLPAPRHQGPTAHAERGKRGNESDGYHHPKTGIGERDINTEEIEFDISTNLELVHGIDANAACVRFSQLLSPLVACRLMCLPDLVFLPDLQRHHPTLALRSLLELFVPHSKCPRWIPMRKI